MAHSSRIRELKRAGSTGKLVDDTPVNHRRGSSGSTADSEKADAEVGDKGDDKIAKLGIEELREQLRKAKREVTNRDTTLKALQRNYETLAAVHEESKKAHQDRKIAFDQISDKYSEAQAKLDKSVMGTRGLHDTIAKLEEKYSKLEREAKKAHVDTAELLKGKQEAFDQLNTLYAEQAQRLSQSDTHTKSMAQKVTEVEAALRQSNLDLEAASRKAQLQASAADSKTRELAGTVVALEAELEQVRVAGAQQVQIVRRQMQDRQKELDDARARATHSLSEAARLQKELGEHQRRLETSASSCGDKEAEIKRLLALEADLQANLRTPQSLNRALTEP